MASDYGLNFGFRRSDETLSTREGRFKTPADADLRVGTAVEIDPANAGYMKQADANAAPTTGLSGLLVQEEDHVFGLFDTPVHDSLSRGMAKRDKYSIIWSGQGVKVWFRNTDEYSRGGRNADAVEMVTLADLAVGDSLGWDGSKWVESDGGATVPDWLTVTAVGSDSVEAVLTF